MKFLFQLEYCIIPEWSEFYIEYQNLKMFIKKFFPTLITKKDVSNTSLNDLKISNLSSNENESGIGLIQNFEGKSYNNPELSNNINEFISLF